MNDTGQRIYKFGISTWFQLWLVGKTYLWIVLLSISIGVVAWSIYTRVEMEIAIGGALFLFVAMIIGGIPMSMYLIRRQFLLLKRYQIGLERDQITLYQDASPIATIHRSEITAVTKIERYGLHICATEQGKCIQISFLTDGYEDIVAQVVAWHPLHQLKGDWIYRVPRPIYMFMFLFGVSLTIVGTTLWAVGLGVILLLAFMGVSFHDARRVTKLSMVLRLIWLPVALSICSICRLIALL